jgi:Flp pilus assembly protein CpaB
VKRSNRLVILVGVLLAVLAFVGIVILLNQPGGAGPTEDVVVTETVLIATEDIEIGTPITPQMVEATEVDPEAVTGTPLRDPSQVGGRPSLFFVAAGTQVSQETIGLNIIGVENIAGQLEPGEKAVAIRLDATQGLNFLVQPGDSVDVVLSEEVAVLQETADSIAARQDNPDLPPRFEEVVGSEEGARTVKTVLQNKRVLYVSATRVTVPQPTPAPGEEGQEGAPQAVPEIESIILIFAGTDQDAEVVRFAQADHSEVCSERQTDVPGCLSVVIRSTDDDAIEETTGVTIDILVEQYGLRIPGFVEQLTEGLEAP